MGLFRQRELMINKSGIWRGGEGLGIKEKIPWDILTAF
jgi:hypothetical protein